MSIEQTVEHALHRVQMHGGVVGVLRSDEAQAGRVVVRPGDVPWLPPEDWGRDTVASIEEDRVRLVLLDAVRPRHGAFTRLITRLRRAHLKPVVVAPSDEFAAALARRRWRSRIIGHGIDQQTIWYPRRRS